MGKTKLGLSPGEAAILNTRNYILRGLTVGDRARLAPDMAPCDLASGEVLYEPGYEADWVWFPLTAVLSVVTVMSDGRTVESDTVGRESAVGILAALGKASCTSRTYVQIPGEAIRLPASRLRRAADESPKLRTLLVRHALANLAQAHQSVACNALHDVNARFCRWLLLSHDRTTSDVVRLTQQYLATMVGVQRTTITDILTTLARAGVIAKGRGWIRILDRDALQAQVCECYDVVQDNLESLIGRAPVAG
ncbi:MAG TPA: Crp/Fnr family transcriptional regulator [Caulobacteraceae bacterium]|jgi:CRP-like cAMP-binding protein